MGQRRRMSVDLPVGWNSDGWPVVRTTQQPSQIPHRQHSADHEHRSECTTGAELLAGEIHPAKVIEEE